MAAVAAAVLMGDSLLCVGRVTAAVKPAIAASRRHPPLVTAAAAAAAVLRCIAVAVGHTSSCCCIPSAACYSPKGRMQRGHLLLLLLLLHCIGPVGVTHICRRPCCIAQTDHHTIRPNHTTLEGSVFVHHTPKHFKLGPQGCNQGFGADTDVEDVVD
jgi:hypothetical protein